MKIIHTVCSREHAKMIQSKNLMNKLLQATEDNSMIDYWLSIFAPLCCFAPLGFVPLAP